MTSIGIVTTWVRLGPCDATIWTCGSRIVVGSEPGPKGGPAWDWYPWPFVEGRDARHHRLAQRAVHRAPSISSSSACVRMRRRAVLRAPATSGRPRAPAGCPRPPHAPRSRLTRGCRVRLRRPRTNSAADSARRAAPSQVTDTRIRRRGRPVPARRTLACVVELLSPGCIEGFVFEAHHRIGEVPAPVLRYRRAACRNGSRHGQRYSACGHNVTPNSYADLSRTEDGRSRDDLARFSANVESITPTTLEKSPTPKSAHSTRCSSSGPWPMALGSAASRAAVPPSIAVGGALETSARVHSPEAACATKGAAANAPSIDSQPALFWALSSLLVPRSTAPAVKPAANTRAPAAKARAGSGLSAHDTGETSVRAETRRQREQGSHSRETIMRQSMRATRKLCAPSIARNGLKRAARPMPSSRAEASSWMRPRRSWVRSSRNLTQLRALRDEVRVRAHLAKLDVKDRWNELEPRVAAVVEQATKSASEASRTAVTEAIHALEKLRSSLP